MAADTYRGKNADELRAEVARLRSDISEITETLAKMSDDAVGEGHGWVRDAARHQTDRIRRSWDSVENEIEHRPLTSMAAAFGIGFALGKLLDR